MKALHKYVWVLFLFLLIACLLLPATSFALSASKSAVITEWEMMWEDNSHGIVQNAASNRLSTKWQTFAYEDGLPEKPANIQAAWIRFKLPEYDLARPALLISKLIAQDVSIYINEKLVYESYRNYSYNKNEILLSIAENEANQMVYILLHTDSDWLGLKKPIIIGEGQTLGKAFMKQEMFDVVIGATLLFVSLAMFLCFLFLNKSYLSGLNSLSIFVFSIGVMLLSLSPYVHTVYKEYGFVIYYMFDISSNLVMPSIFIFFEKIFGRGPYGLITRFRKVQVYISTISVIWLFASFISDEIEKYYISVTMLTFAGTVVFGNMLLIGCFIKYSLQKNREAIIITIGFGIFAMIAALEIVWYFIQDANYDLIYWKWGIFCFITSLIIILVRRILLNYEQVVSYSKQLEVFNNELQRAEKMDIISQLAASVAHEVRNPLQVTRGFLQLLGEKSTNEKEKGFMGMAIDELDRASDIITDFLTFAKPQLEEKSLLNVAEELKKIEGILVPLANMQGGVIKADLSPYLYVRGDSSKLKQAIINIIKNSIEALNENGTILIRAYEDDSNNVVIAIKDNGEGMNEADLKRLGEPYYSKKSKGTGLGLMVTFRIIEVMDGKIEFSSKKGVGTEAIIYIPSAKK